MQRRDHRLAAGLEPRAARRSAAARAAACRIRGCPRRRRSSARRRAARSRARAGSASSASIAARNAARTGVRQGVDRRVVKGEDRDVAVAQDGVTRVHATRSSASAMPCPTPMHIVHSARRPPRALELERRRGRKARSAHAERVPERDRPAVRVHVRGVVGQPEPAQHGERLRGKCLVELDHVEVRRSRARAGPSASPRPAPGRGP